MLFEASKPAVSPAKVMIYSILNSKTVQTGSLFEKKCFLNTDGE
jgi:hypothetical protein